MRNFRDNLDIAQLARKGSRGYRLLLKILGVGIFFGGLNLTSELVILPGLRRDSRGAPSCLSS
jgi:hypothetical protein